MRLLNNNRRYSIVVLTESNASTTEKLIDLQYPTTCDNNAIGCDENARGWFLNGYNYFHVFSPTFYGMTVKIQFLRITLESSSD